MKKTTKRPTTKSVAAKKPTLKKPTLKKPTLKRPVAAKPGSLVRSAILDKIAAGKRNLTDLVIERDETRTLTYESREFNAVFHEFRPKSVDDLKDIMGIPDEAIKRPTEAARPHKMVRPTIGTNLQARVISPDILDDKKVSEKVRTEALITAKRAAEMYIFGDSRDVLHMRPLIDRFLELKEAMIFIPLFRNITINNGGTLMVAPSAHVLWANNIKMYGTGRIESQGPLTIRSTTLQGNL